MEKKIVLGHMGGSLTEASDCGFSSGHDLRVLEFEPCVMLCAGSAEPAWDSLSPFLSPAPLHVLSLSLSKINKETLKKSPQHMVLEKPDSNLQTQNKTKQKQQWTAFLQHTQK